MLAVRFLIRFRLSRKVEYRSWKKLRRRREKRHTQAVYPSKRITRADQCCSFVIFFFPAFDNHDALEIVEDRIINSACIDFYSIRSFKCANCIRVHATAWKKSIETFSFFLFYFLSPRNFLFLVASFFRKWREKGGIVRFETSGYKSSFIQTRFDAKLESYCSIIANFFF